LAGAAGPNAEIPVAEQKRVSFLVTQLESVGTLNIN
jgi:hypothetical protein